MAGNLAKVGAVAAVGLGVAVKSGLSSLAELESAVASVDGAIKQMGLTGKVTGGQVATWANEIEASVGAAFDDKAITQATSTLIRFGKVTTGNLRPAMDVITDLAAQDGRRRERGHAARQGAGRPDEGRREARPPGRAS